MTGYSVQTRYRKFEKGYEFFTKCISEINNTQLDDPQKIDVAMPMYNLIEYNDDYS